MSAAIDWAAVPYNVLDFEATGIDATQERIVQAALVAFRPGTRPTVRTWIVDPGIDIPEAAAAVHGYTRDRAIAEATHTPEQMLFELTGFIALDMGHDIPLVAFNAAYDVTLLECENVRHGVDTLRSRMARGNLCPVLDPHVIDKKISRRKGKRTLEATCGHYQVVHTGAHDAAGDAIATGRLLPRIMASVDAVKAKIQHHSPVVLHHHQIEWRRAQMDSLRSYFDRQGTVHDGCCGAWPVHTDACATVHREVVTA